MAGNDKRMRRLGIVVRTSPERRRDVLAEITDLATPNLSFYLLVATSTTIAAYGLLADSTAVVIGAMLVAPLMGPIFGIAMALIRGQVRLLRRSLLAEALGLLLAVGLGVLIGLMPFRVDFGAEIVKRTQPTIYDIIIAVAAALAGTYCLMDEKLSPTLPGIAISVSLLPPLATCGLCIAAGRWDWAGGAFLLFAANFLAIEIVAALVFSFFGMAEMGRRETMTVSRFLGRFGLSLLLLLAMAVFMTHTLIGIIVESRFADGLERALASELRGSVGATLSEFRYERKPDFTEVVAVVLTPQEFEPEHVAAVEDAVRQKLDADIHLVVRSLISRDADRSGPVFLPTQQTQETAEASEQAAFLTRASQALTEGLGDISGARLVEIRRDASGGQTTVTAVVRAPEAVTPAQAARLQAGLAHTLEAPIALVVRTVPICVVDANGYLYDTPKQPAPPSAAELAFQRRAEAALKSQLDRHVQGACVVEVRHSREGGRLLVFGVVRTPRAVRPEEVAEMERNFQRYVDPDVRLVIRSLVEADVSAEGYVADFTF